MKHVSALAAAILVLAACTASESAPEGADSAPATSEAAATTPAPASTSSPDPARGSQGRPILEAAPTPMITTTVQSDNCLASRVSARWAGTLPTAEAKAQIAAAVGKRAIRYYAEGDPITMDFSEDRLNVVIGKDGRIAEFRCG